MRLVPLRKEFNFMKTNLILIFTAFTLGSTVALAWSGHEVGDAKNVTLEVSHSQNKNHGIILEKTIFAGKTAYFLTERNGHTETSKAVLTAAEFRSLYQGFREKFVSAKKMEKVSAHCVEALNINRSVDRSSESNHLCEDALPAKVTADLEQWYKNTLSIIKSPHQG